MTKINTYHDGIYEIKNFVSDSFIDEILSIIDLNDESNWDHSHPGHIDSDMKFIQLFKAHSDIMKNKIITYFKNVENLIDIVKIKRLKTGEFMPGHSDQGPDNKNLKICFGIVLYLNDNFEGGEIYYKNLDIKIKPEKGSLLIHKSSIYHEVLPILNGTRYSMTTFVIGDNTTEFIVD